MNLLFVSGCHETPGFIANQNKSIDMLGYEAGTQFATGKTKNQPAETYNAGLLDVYFTRRRVLNTPKVSLSNKPSPKFFWSIDAGWAIPISESNQLVLQQVALGEGEVAKKLAGVGFNQNGATPSLDNVVIQKIPSTGGLFLSVNMGIYVKNQATTKKKRV